MNLPSGGMKLSSPGFSDHRFSRTHGWKEGRAIVRWMPECLAWDVPPGAVSERRISGTPEILAVNSMEPVARAEMGRPEGEDITCSDSKMSTYSSLEVWRTFGRRHGIDGWFVGAADGLSADDREVGPPMDGAELVESECVCGRGGGLALVHQLD